MGVLHINTYATCGPLMGYISRILTSEGNRSTSRHRVEEKKKKKKKLVNHSSKNLFHQINVLTVARSNQHWILYNKLNRMEES